MTTNDYIECFDPYLGLEQYDSDTVSIGIEFSVIIQLCNPPVFPKYFSSIYFKRPGGDIFPALIPSIREYIISFEHIPTSAKQICLINYVFILLLVAARERVIEDEVSRSIEKEAKFLEPFASLYHKQLDLFRYVARMSAYLDIPTPIDLRDEKKSWGQSIHRGISKWGNPNYIESKKQRSKELRDKGNILQRGENPFQDDEPELKSLIKYALKLSKQRPGSSNREKEMRKDIAGSLEHLRKAYTSLANYIQKEPGLYYTRVINRRHYLVGINNHLTEIRHT